MYTYKKSAFCSKKKVFNVFLVQRAYFSDHRKGKVLQQSNVIFQKLDYWPYLVNWILLIWKILHSTLLHGQEVSKDRRIYYNSFYITYKKTLVPPGFEFCTSCLDFNVLFWNYMWRFGFLIKTSWISIERKWNSQMYTIQFWIWSTTSDFRHIWWNLGPSWGVVIS